MDGLVSLPEFVASTRAARFEWGVTDCALWCASAVEAMCGHDPAADLRGTYSSRFEARQLAMREGGLANLVARRMRGVPGVSPMSGIGDGVAVCKVGAQTVCCVILEGRAMMRGAAGVRLVDDFEIVRGWTCRRL